MEPMQEIRELLAKLTECTPEELSRLAELVEAEFSRMEAEPPTPDNIGVLDELDQADEKVQGEIAGRAQAEADAVAKAEELKNRWKARREQQPAEDEPPAEGEGEGAPAEGEGEDPARAAAAAARPVGMAASMSSGRQSLTVSPERAPAGRSGFPLRASHLLAQGAHYQVGAPLDHHALGDAMLEVIRRTPRGTPGVQIVASANWMEMYDRMGRRLSGDNSGWGNEEIVSRALSSEGIQASGGICAPVDVDWAVPEYATADRPLKDGLANFGVSRGGLMWVTPPDISALAGATGIWTEATDAAPGLATKPVLAIACGNENTVLVDSVATRVQFGNMFGRFAPEQTAANTALAVAAAARIAELNLLAKIDAASTVVTTSNYVGAGRDLLATMDLVAARYRYAHRLPRTQQLHAIFPDWAKDLLRADIARELAHDTSGLDPRALTDQQIESWIGARGITPIWMLDGRPANTAQLTNNPFQGFLAQSTGAINKWPVAASTTQIELDWNLFLQNSMQFLDGGELNLGVVRDSTLDATNDYEIFTETFEGVASRWIDSLLVRSYLIPNGASASSVATTGYVIGN